MQIKLIKKCGWNHRNLCAPVSVYDSCFEISGYDDPVQAAECDPSADL